MPRLSREERERAIGMLQAGLSARRVSRMFNCSHPTIIKLRDRFHASGTTSDRPRPGRPRVTTANEDRQLILWHLRDRFLTSTSSVRRYHRDTGRVIGVSTIRRRLHAAGLHSRRPYNGQRLPPFQRQVRVKWSTEALLNRFTHSVNNSFTNSLIH